MYVHSESFRRSVIIIPLVGMSHGLFIEHSAKSVRYSPSVNWEYAGPIIESEKIRIAPCAGKPERLWNACLPFRDLNNFQHFYGPTPLIAAMRAFVASKFGNEVEDIKETVWATLKIWATPSFRKSLMNFISRWKSCSKKLMKCAPKAFGYPTNNTGVIANSATSLRWHREGPPPNPPVENRLLHTLRNTWLGEGEEEPEEGNRMSKYHRQVSSTNIDVYDVLVAWDVRNPAIQHAIKKLLQPGNRGHKDTIQDLSEAIESIERGIAIERNLQKKEQRWALDPYMQSAWRTWCCLHQRWRLRPHWRKCLAWASRTCRNICGPMLHATSATPWRSALRRHSTKSQDGSIWTRRNHELQRTHFEASSVLHSNRGRKERDAYLYSQCFKSRHCKLRKIVGSNGRRNGAQT